MSTTNIESSLGEFSSCLAGILDLIWRCALSIDPGFNLFTSFRYDPKLRTAPFNTEVNGEELPYLFFPYHVERLVKTAQKFGWQKSIQTMAAPDAASSLKRVCDKAVLESSLSEKETGIGLRVLLTPAGEFHVEKIPTRPFLRDPLEAAHFNPSAEPQGPSDQAPQTIFDVYIDTVPTPSSVYTSFKTTSRAHYDAARTRAGIKDRIKLKEVILHNERGEITEGSVRNVAFWRDGTWVAPLEEAGGLPGTVRRYLLERGLVQEGVIRKEDLRLGEWVLLINGFDVTVLGKIVERPSAE
ncbi:aminotransferase class IV-domain-containing protein [Phellopilus nigrolimitatus]|nr:aminotransferase class IV-domain-containing protein [Phellopilus nigrolimitatus]